MKLYWACNCYGELFGVLPNVTAPSLSLSQTGIKVILPGNSCTYWYSVRPAS